jgi:hypothetical protein
MPGRSTAMHTAALSNRHTHAVASDSAAERCGSNEKSGCRRRPIASTGPRSNRSLPSSTA